MSGMPVRDIAMPDTIRHLPRDHRGFPIPWFVHRDANGTHDFRIVGAGKVEYALVKNVCFICGGTLGRNKAFVIGPMCSINRISAEPPVHPPCGRYAAMVCPFLTQPRMKRNAKDLPEETAEAPGKMVLHNPGVACVWVTREYRIMPVDNGMLLRLGEPIQVTWLCQGQPATRGDVIRAIDKGLPILIDEARQESEEAVQALLQAIHRMRQYLPGQENGEQGAAPSKNSRASAA